MSLQVCWGGHSGPSIINRKPASIINTVTAGGVGVLLMVSQRYIIPPPARSCLSASGCRPLGTCCFCCGVYRKNTEQCGSAVSSRRPPATSACPGIISPQIKSVKGTLFSVVGTKNTIKTERFVIYFFSLTSAVASKPTLMQFCQALLTNSKEKDEQVSGFCCLLWTLYHVTHFFSLSNERVMKQERSLQI